MMCVSILMSHRVLYLPPKSLTYSSFPFINPQEWLVFHNCLHNFASSIKLPFLKQNICVTPWLRNLKLATINTELLGNYFINNKLHVTKKCICTQGQKQSLYVIRKIDTVICFVFRKDKELQYAVMIFKMLPHCIKSVQKGKKNHSSQLMAEVSSV